MFRRRLLVPIVLLVPVLAGGFLLRRIDGGGPRVFEQVLQLIDQNAVDSVAIDRVYEEAAAGALRALRDPYAELYSPEQLQRMKREDLRGRYGGLGMSIEEQHGRIRVIRVFPASPAERGGVRAGDEIVAVDTSSVSGWKVSDVSSRLTGLPGTTVRVRFARPGSQPLEETFTRASVHLPAVPYHLVLDDDIGYLPLERFSETASVELASALLHLSQQNVRGLILDLRGNGGGSLDEALNVTNLFIGGDAEIVSVRSRHGAPMVYRAGQRPMAPTIPLVILVDEGSASASEIVAGALQDHDRALLVGTTSFGKGLVQTMWNLDGGWAVKFTTATWYTPSGRSIQKPRKLDDRGRLVDDRPDSLETDSVRVTRPVFHSDRGRPVYGGGGVTPDVIVGADTLTSPEQKLYRAFAPKAQDTHITVYDYALELAPQARPDFSVTAANRSELVKRLRTAGLLPDSIQVSAGGELLDRWLGDRVAQIAYGDSTVFRRRAADDPQLGKALALLKSGTTQEALLALAPQEKAQ